MADDGVVNDASVAGVIPAFKADVTNTDRAGRRGVDGTACRWSPARKASESSAMALPDVAKVRTIEKMEEKKQPKQ